MNLSERAEFTNSVNELPFESLHVKTRNLFRCPICSRQFRHWGQHVSHLQEHQEAKPYKCKLCLNSYMVSASLRRHMRIHVGKNTLQCRFCRKSFSQSAALGEHVKQHIGEKNFRCSFCPTYFATPEGCQKHMENHTQDLPFVCNHCPASFHSILTLAVHMRLHRKAKPFKSADSLKSMGYYPGEYRSQGDVAVKECLQCDVCGKSFSQLRALQMHKRIYTGEKQLKCRYCTKSFAQFCIFQRHLRTHSCEYSVSYELSENYPSEKNRQFENAQSDLSETQDDSMVGMNAEKSIPFRERSAFVASVYGCGLCNDMFQIEKEFMDHCVNHSPSVSFDFHQFTSRRPDSQMQRSFGWF